MEALQRFLRDRAEGDLLPWPAQAEAAARFGLSLGQVEDAALSLDILPARYQRNRQTISVAQQLTLRRSRVAIVGCGGLGGFVIEELARLGVGTLVAVDPDVFEEHNLNRQLLSSVAAVGRPKVDLAGERVAAVNPAVAVVAERRALAPQNAVELLSGSNLVVDALDSIEVRLALRDACAQLGLPLIHGAIAGWFGQVTTEFPGDGTLDALYGRRGEGKGAERQLGNPSFTPAVVASLETAEACKILLAAGEPLRQRVLSINLLDMSFEEIPVHPLTAPR